MGKPGKTRENPPQMIHVWYIYLQNWVIYGVNVGKYPSSMDALGTFVTGLLLSWFDTAVTALGGVPHR